jgi:putative endonuclease
LEAGLWGERQAERYLRAKHFRILGRRVLVGPRDELDLVARSPDQVLVFVEVKTRADEEFGRPAAAVDQRKRRALSRAAWRYLHRLNPKPNYFRFDVVEVIGTEGMGAPEIRHIENAFPFSGNRRITW